MAEQNLSLSHDLIVLKYQPGLRFKKYLNLELSNKKDIRTFIVNKVLAIFVSQIVSLFYIAIYFSTDMLSQIF